MVRLVVVTIAGFLVTVAAVCLRLAVGTCSRVDGRWLIGPGRLVVLSVEGAGSSGQKSNGELFHSDFSLSIIKTKITIAFKACWH